MRRYLAGPRGKPAAVHSSAAIQRQSSRAGSRLSVTRVGGACLNCARGSAGPAFPMPISCRPRVRGRHCFAGGGPRNLGAQCAGYSHRLETEHEKLAAVVGGANTRVNWGQDHPRFSWCGTGVRLRLGLRWLRLVWFDSTRPCVSTIRLVIGGSADTHGLDAVRMGRNRSESSPSQALQL